MATPPVPNPVFNPADFATETGFSEAQASALYPRMATESTSTAKQLFLGGMETSDIASDTVLNVGSLSSTVNLVGNLQVNGLAGNPLDVLTSNGDGVPATFQPPQAVSDFPDGLTTCLINCTTADLLIGNAMVSPHVISLGNGACPTKVVGTLISTQIDTPTTATPLFIGGSLLAPAKVYLGSGGSNVAVVGGLIVQGAAGLTAPKFDSSSTLLTIGTGTSTGITLGKTNNTTTSPGYLTTTQLLTANGGISATSLLASTTLGVSGLSTLAGVNSGAHSASSLTSTGTLGATGLSTLAAVNASGLVSANGGVSATSLLASTTLGVSGLSTLAGVTSGAHQASSLTSTGALGVSGASSLSTVIASGLITANGGVSGTSLLASTTLGVTGTSTLGVVNSGAHSATSLTSTGTLGATGLSTLAAVNASGLVSANGGVSATSLLASTTLGVSGLSTLAGVNASGLVSANGGVSATSLLASTTLGVSGLSTLAGVNASGLVSANGGVSATSLASTTLGVSGLSTLAAVDASGLVSANGGLTATTITAPSLNSVSGALSIGAGSTGSLTLGKAVNLLTVAGTLLSSIDISTSGSIKCGYVDSNGGVLQVGNVNAASVAIGGNLVGALGVPVLSIGNGAALIGDIMIGCGNDARTGSTKISTKGSGGIEIGGAGTGGITLTTSLAPVSINSGVNTSKVDCSGTTLLIGNGTSTGLTLGKSGFTTACAGPLSAVGLTSTGALTVSGAGATQFGSGTFTLGAPITLSSTLPTLGTLVAPNSTQVGGFTLGSAYNAAMPIGTNALSTIIIQTAGVYLVNLDLSGAVAALPTNYYITIGGTSSGIPTGTAAVNWGMSSVNGTNISFDIARMMRLTAGTVIFNLNLAGQGMTNTYGSAFATRIA